MRTWTLVFSICAHAVAFGAFIVAPLFATADLPDAHRPITFESIIPIDVPDVPVAPRPQPADTSTATQTIPTTEPADLPPDNPPPASNPPPDVVAGGTGVPGDVLGPVGDPVIAPPPPQVRKDPVPVGGNIRPPTRVAYVQPVYPQIALASRKEGTVILQAVIDEHGNVREVKVLRSIQLLDDAAIQAVSQWKFTPTLLNGTPVPVVMTVTVAFALQK
jgi:periplasmic protein TonB